MRILLCLLSILVPLKAAMGHTPDDFWQEYQTAKQSGLVKNSVEHVRNLSTRLDTDTPARLESKKSAILWFMATGGKNGFRKKPATPAEKQVLENALIFATILHEVHHSEDLLPIIAIRKNAGITTENDKIKIHLISVQRIITATRLMLESALPPTRFRPYIQELFNKEYMRAVLYCRNTRSISKEQWQQEAVLFSDIFTRGIDQRFKQTFFENLEFSLDKSATYIGIEEPVSGVKLHSFRQFVVDSCTPDPKIFPSTQKPQPKQTPSAVAITHRAMRIMTDNGLVIERGSDGSIKLVPQRDIQIGFMYLGAGSIFQAGTGISMGPIQLNNRQTEEEFLFAISAFATIVEKTYL